MRQFIVVQKFDRVAKLIAHVSHLIQWVRLEIVLSLKTSKKLDIIFIAKDFVTDSSQRQNI